jgi:phosphoribosylaminoimidazole-succinocarboxamide synthase
MSYQQFIADNINYIFTSTDLDLPNKRIGKVRDSYEVGDKMILISTDRQSAFDRNLASIPFKGQVLNQVSAYWFELTKDIVPNHLISIPDPNVIIGKKLTIFPVEFVVRGFLTGSTSTSVWTNYSKGVRDYCGNILSDGLVKNQKFDKPILTPTTKSDEHDELISAKEIVEKGLMTQKEWDYCYAKSLEIFEFAQKKALSKGLILVDTKLEFGKDSDGNIVLADEIFTPDSSRYWLSGSYEQRIMENKEPENIDKEFLRLWFIDNCDPYNDKILPTPPQELIVELSCRYIQLFEMITGQKFEFGISKEGFNERIKKQFAKILKL